jgi:hypothetical protein
MPPWRYRVAQQIARVIVEFDGIPKDITRSRNNHRMIATKVESRSKIPVFVRRDSRNPVGSRAEFIRNKGQQYRMQGLLRDYNLSGNIEATNLCIDLANGLVTEGEYWVRALFHLCLGGTRLPTWDNAHLDMGDQYQFPIVQRIYHLATNVRNGITETDVLHCFQGRENIGITEALQHLNTDSRVFSPEQRRGVREIMKLMSSTREGFGANWLVENSGRFSINPNIQPDLSM